jgi:hypothetical protein
VVFATYGHVIQQVRIAQEAYGDVSKKSASKPLVAGLAFDPMPMIGPRALDIDEVAPKSAGGDLRCAVRMKLVKV